MAETEPNAPETLSLDRLPSLRTEDGELEPLFLDAIRAAIEAAALVWWMKTPPSASHRSR